MESILRMMHLAQFPQEAYTCLSEVTRKLWEDPQTRSALQALKEQYLAGDECLSQRLSLSQTARVHPFTLDLVLLLYAFTDLEDTYRQKGISHQIFLDSLQDLRYKLEECRTVYGIWGNFVFFWYRKFFDCALFALGRLQYELYILKTDIPGLAQEGDQVLNCHIPSSGPLTPELVDASLALAWDFFQPKGPMLVRCSSWLLYPANYDLYPEGSNLRMFYDRFTIHTSTPAPTNPNAWRIFGTMEQLPERLPENTRLQRAFKEFLAQGNCMGTGLGTLVYER